MEDKKHFSRVFAAIFAAAAFGGLFYFRWLYRVPMKEYTAFALYMAVMDDEIARNELEGQRFSGRTVIFPPRKVSLQYRYHLFLSLNKKKSLAVLEKETAQLETRLKESRLSKAQHGAEPQP